MINFTKQSYLNQMKESKLCYMSGFILKIYLIKNSVSCQISREIKFITFK